MTFIDPIRPKNVIFKKKKYHGLNLHKALEKKEVEE